MVFISCQYICVPGFCLSYLRHSSAESILIFREYLFCRTCFLLVSNIQRHKFFFSDENSSAHWNSAAYVLVRRNYDGKSPVNIKCHNLYFFKEGKRGKYLICIANSLCSFFRYDKVARGWRRTG